MPAVQGPVLRRSCHFFPTSGQNQRRYSLHLPTEGWPGWVGLSAQENTGMVDQPKVVTNLLLLLLNEKIMVVCCQRLRGHRTVSKVRASVLRTRNCQTRPKLSYRKASGEQFSLQVPLERCQRWWRGHRGRQTNPSSNWVRRGQCRYHVSKPATRELVVNILLWAHCGI